jgi:two-component system sensor histidine kinase SenX3
MTALTSLLLVAVAVVAAVVGFVVARRTSSPPTIDAAGPTVEAAAVPRAAEPDEPSAAPVSDVLQEHLLERLSEAVDHIEQGVVVCDETGTDIFRNRVARGYTEARDGLVLVEAAVGELLQEALAGRSVRREVELFGPPAQSFVVTARPFSGSVGLGGLAIVEDRSLQRRTETVRRDFVANISHELKTPIGALGLLAETIRDEPDSEVVERLAERMIIEADRAGSTVDDLLELSRIEFGDDTEFDEISVQSIVGEAAGRIAAAADHADIALDIEISPLVRIVGDRRQLVSAVFNLLDNSVKYSPEGSEIRVRAELDEAAGDAPSDSSAVVHLSIEDTGIGIPRRDLDRIFERFYRVDRARSRVTGGTGLGLAIVRHVASNHGGVVTVESTEGVGTTFTLSLPAVAPIRLPGAADPAAAPSPTAPQPTSAPAEAGASTRTTDPADEPAATPPGDR